MKRKTYSLCFQAALLVFSAGCISPSTNHGRMITAPIQTAGTKDNSVSCPQLQLPEYERLTYQVRWMGIPVGTLTSTINGIKEFNGRRVYVLEALFKSNQFLSALHKVDDRFVSYMDVEERCSLRHEVYRNEGRHRKEAVTDFDQVNHRAKFRNLTDKSEKEFSIPPKVQDTLSASYYFRFFPLKVGSFIEYVVANNEKNYELFIVAEARINLRLPGAMGFMDAFLVQPYAKLDGKKVEKGNVRLFYSGDSTRVPLLGMIKAPVFTNVTVALTNIERRQ